MPETIEELKEYKNRYIRNIQICKNDPNPDNLIALKFHEKELKGIETKIAENKTCIKCRFHNVPIARVASICDNCLKTVVR